VVREKFMLSLKRSIYTLFGGAAVLLLSSDASAQCNWSYNNVGCTHQAINDLYCYHNAFRQAYGLAPLQVNGALQHWAYVGSVYQSWWSPNYWAHIDTPNRLRSAGFPYGSENVAFSLWHQFPTWQNTSLGAFISWWNSPVHQAAIMNPNFRQMGLWCVSNGTKTWWTAMFG
jgi:uncharacterized protein YkwD